ncbi:hypothetical protein DAPPUDRAFT_233111 [Daphnia pulex]|uniref:Uncharacterized protein n=1 Tax=Daphnia pulex TaxID=6669 RepID=E9FT82_DAPPU|nr:hypothetical protein DAPPUDRAFT_233111 [Daphnia pulex]|eukprot:EFX89694.1 hypothetical protein DAPPUDRAFT_233111 [Daphnia pulex]
MAEKATTIIALNPLNQKEEDDDDDDDESSLNHSTRENDGLGSCPVVNTVYLTM